MGEPRNTDGQFTPEHTDGELLAAVRTHEPAATSEVADEVGMTRQGTDRRLRLLRDAGRVNSKKIGASLVWFAPDQDGAQEPTDTARDAPDPTPGDTPGDTGTPTRADESEDIEDVIGELRDQMPGSGANLDGREQAVRDIYEYLKEQGSGQKSDFKTVVNVAPTGYDDFNSFYTNAVTGPGVLQDLPGVNPPGEGGHTYQYTGSEGEGS